MNVTIEEVEETAVTVTVETVDPDYAEYGARLAAAEGAIAEIQQELENFDPTVTPADLGISIPDRVPLSVNSGAWVPEGLRFSDQADGLSLAFRYASGRLRVGDAVEDSDAVTKKQLDEAAFGGYDPMNFNSSVGPNFQRSRIFNSSSSNMTQTYVGNSSVNNVIIGSNQSNIKASRQVSRTAIIASDKSNINGGRIQTAIIASTEAEIEAWTDPATLKWNSVIIASRLGRIQASNSYTLVTGKGTVSNGSAQLVCGQNNIIEPSRSVDDPLKKAFIVGNGVGNDNPDLTVRSTAFYVLQNGTAWVQNGFEIDNGGLIMRDTVTGTRYRLTIANGELNITPV